ncbi:MAG: flavodoxin family protein [Merdibacter sp.]
MSGSRRIRYNGCENRRRTDEENVLIIAGSPRRENSDLLCEAFAQGAREAGHSVEMVTSRSLHIAPCQACYGCRASHVCVQKDDMETLMSRMLACDVLVLATPVYFYSMSAQMKAMIDRTLPVYAQMRERNCIS